MLELNISPADPGMDWLQFIAAMSAAWAWPTLAFALTFMFRRQISGILDKVRKVSVGDAQFDLSEKLSEIEAVASLPQPEEAQPGMEATLPIDELAVAAEADPVKVGPTPLEEVVHAAEKIRELQEASTAEMADRLAVERKLLEQISRNAIERNALRHFRTPSNVAFIAADWERVVSRLIELEGSSGFIWGAADKVPFEFLLGTLFGRGQITHRQFSMLREMFEVRQAAGQDDVTELDALRFNGLAKQILAELGSPS